MKQEILLAAACLAACACGPADRRLPVAFSQANNAEPYRQHVNDQLTAAAAKVPSVEITKTGAPRKAMMIGKTK